MSQQPPEPPYGQQPGYGQQPPYGPQPGYGPPPYGYVQRPDHPQALSAMIFGILGLAVCQVLGIVGYVQGRKALAEIEASGGAYGGEGMAKAGKICGLVAMILLAVMVVGFVLYLVVLVAIVGFSVPA